MSLPQGLESLSEVTRPIYMYHIGRVTSMNAIQAPVVVAVILFVSKNRHSVTPLQNYNYASGTITLASIFQHTCE